MAIEIRRSNQLRLVVEIPVIYRVLGTSQVVGLGISEPSTVLPTNSSSTDPHFPRSQSPVPEKAFSDVSMSSLTLGDSGDSEAAAIIVQRDKRTRKVNAEAR